VVKDSGGFFITIEGVDGVGKTTTANALVKKLVSLGHEVVWTREPGGSELAESIRDLVLQPTLTASTPETDLLLMFAARLDHLEKVIKPSLAKGKLVICERFTDSTYAYQVSAGGVSKTLFITLEQNLSGLIEPDLTLLLDAKLPVILERLGERKVNDKFENSIAAASTYFRSLREGFIARQHSYPHRIRPVNANQEYTAMLTEIKRWGDWIHEHTTHPLLQRQQQFTTHQVLDVDLLLWQLASIFKG